MVQTHKRLQQYNRHYCKALMMGIYGCRWHRYQQSRDKTSILDWCFFILLVIDFLYMTFWFYFWLVCVDNDYDNINWFMSDSFGIEIFRFDEVFVGLTSATFAYVVLLMLLGLFHIIYGHEVYIHKIHKVLLVLVAAGCIAVSVVVDKQYHEGWSLLFLSLQVFGPFLQIGGVVIATVLSYVVACKWVWLYSLGKKLVCLWLYSSVMIVIYLSPLFLECPCISDLSLGPKPFIFAHRGLAEGAPENTNMSFTKALQVSDIRGVESDVTVSWDGIPYLMHDSTLFRTTDVSKVFPSRAKDYASDFNISDVKKLNAGSWYINDDPFGTVRSLSQEDKNWTMHQQVPTLTEILELISTANVSFMFDIYFNTANPPLHPYTLNHKVVIVQTILKSSLDPKRIWWLYKNILGDGNFTAVQSVDGVYPSVEQLLADGVFITNMQYDTLHLDSYREYKDNNISGIVYIVDTRWLLSYMWCAGVSYVTTNRAKTLSAITSPLYYLPTRVYYAIWISVDGASAIIVVTMFIALWVRKKGKVFNPETLSLHAAKHRLSSAMQNKNMKEKLIHAADGFQEIVNAEYFPCTSDTELGIVGMQSAAEPSGGDIQQPASQVANHANHDVIVFCDGLSRSSSMQSHNTDISYNDV